MSTIYKINFFIYMADGARQVQPVDRNKKRQSYVMIISHEADFVPFELTNAETLTQFFTKELAFVLLVAQIIFCSF